MNLYWYIWNTTRGYRFRLFLLFMFVMTATVTEAMIPAIIGEIVDQIFYLKSLKGFLLCFFGYAGLYLFNQTMHGCLNYLWAKLKVTYLVEIRRECFDQLLRLKAERLSDMKSGDIFRRIQDDVEAFLELIHRSLFYVLGNLVQFCISVIYLLYVDLYFGLVAIILTPLMAFSLKKFGFLLKRKQTEIQREKGFTEAWIFELIDGMQEWKLLNSGEWVKRQYLRKTGNIIAGEKANAYAEIAADGVNGGLTLAGQLILYLISAWRIVGGSMTIGQFVASASYYVSCARYFNAIGKKISVVSANLVSIERVFDFMNWAEEENKPNAADREIAKGEIIFENVNFSFGNTPVLREVSFSVAPGEKVAIVGRSGEGKSTLLSLIYRLYEVTGGNICIDGRNIEEFTLKSLRKQIGVVQQSSGLFAGSIRKNITFTDDPRQDGQVWKLLKGLRMDGVVKQYSDGLDTLVEDGENTEGYISLSGGQKQRIAIARALYKRPRILLLDEATSSLDEKTENAIYQYILEYLPDVTVLSAAHRFSTVLKADRIIVMEDGRISAQGKSEELMKKSVVYSTLYEEYRKAEETGGGTP